jgi:hypothetical protein
MSESTCASGLDCLPRIWDNGAMNRVHAPLIIIVLTAVFGAAILTAPFNPLVKRLMAEELPDIAECKKTQREFACYEAFYEAKIQASSAVDTLAEMQERAKSDPYVLSQCHQLTHVVGREAFIKYGTLASAFTKGDSYCWSGYYHGVTEKAIATMGADRIRNETNTVCAELAQAQKYSFDHYNCVHGLGHGMMTVDNFDLFKSLTSCDLITDGWERESCYGGVYMENVMVAVRGDGSSKYLKPDDLMYPCNAVDTTYKQQCYLMQTSYALQQTGYNFATVAGLCQQLKDANFIPTCYQSLGRDASGSASSEPIKTKANCDQTPDRTGLENCMLGAVRDFIAYFHSDVQAKEYCGLYDAGLNERCLQETASYYASF